MCIGIFGGTFDPVHNGHIQILRLCLQQLPLDTIHVIPCKQPVLKEEAYASSQHRMAMLKIALSSEPKLLIDERELQRSTPSYTVDTLRSLRQQHKEEPLCFIIGMDAFSGLLNWHQWKELIHLSHFILINRPNANIQLNKPLTQMIHQHGIDSPQLLSTRSHGYIFKLSIDPVSISSRSIRKGVQLGNDQSHLLPTGVYDYLLRHQLYSSPLKRIT